MKKAHYNVGFGHVDRVTKDFKSSVHLFPAKTFQTPPPAQAEDVKDQEYVCCLSCMSTDSVRSFVFDICDGASYENGSHNVCRHPVPLPLKPVDIISSK